MTNLNNPADEQNNQPDSGLNPNPNDRLEINPPGQKPADDNEEQQLISGTEYVEGLSADIEDLDIPGNEPGESEPAPENTEEDYTEDYKEMDIGKTPFANRPGQTNS